MSVAICSSWSSSTASFPLEKKQEVVLGSLLVSVPTRDDVAAVVIKNDEEEEEEVERPPPGQFDLWTSIQAQQIKAKESKLDEPYVHPSSSRLMSQKSLEICTESLGSETGSDDYYDDDVDYSIFSVHRPTKQVVVAQQQQEEHEEEEEGVIKREEHAASSAVNYHCSVGRGRSPSRSFPPPLPSISCRDGPCVQMRPHRKDGRLVVEAVPVRSQNYLHAERQGGRLLLCFINNNAAVVVPKRNAANTEQTQEELVDEDQELEEEEVEVVDRGTVVEVKVSTQPQKQRSGARKVHRSSIVINKFVSCSHVDKENVDENVIDVSSSSSSTSSSTLRRTSTTSTTTAAAAAVAASSLGAFPAADGGVSLQPCFSDDDKNLVLLTTSKRRNREELLTDMKGCSQLRKPLFIWETSCIATSSS